MILSYTQRHIFNVVCHAGLDPASSIFMDSGACPGP
jgi:hypothetical protein